MGGPEYDCLLNPLGAVRSTFEKVIASGSDPSTFSGNDWGAVDVFRQFLADPSFLSQVPVLNSNSIKWIQPNTLVRFRGMVQDMLGNEFYVGAYKDGAVWRTNKFMDFTQSPMGITTPDMHIWERRLLYCVPVPGLNSWTEIYSSEVAAADRGIGGTSPQREKRPRMEDDASDHMDMVSDDECRSSAVKKMKGEDHASPSSQCKVSVIEGASSTSKIFDFNKSSAPCLVKIYDCAESELKLNEVFEFVGVFTMDSEVNMDEDDNIESSNGFEDDLVSFPSDKVPRLHCLIHRKLDVHDFLQTPPLSVPSSNFVKEIRESLLKYLTAILGNDGIAAQYMLLHLLSKIHARTDNLAVGKLSLNLTSLDKESVSVFGNRLSQTIKNLLPFTQSIPLSVEYLNTVSLAPKKDYQLNRLVPGVLQLAEGSHMIIDETQLEAGTLNSTGIENARLLKYLSESQKLEYDFQYYKMEMTADVQLLILSEGKSNIVPADIVIPFQPSSVGLVNAIPTESLEAWRWYLATVRSSPYSVGTEIEKIIEDDLVARRQADPTLNYQDLSRWLTMARLISVSYGETELSLEHWQMMKELERLRKERLK